MDETYGERTAHRPGGGNPVLYYAVFGNYEALSSIDEVPEGFSAKRHSARAKDSMFTSLLEPPAYGLDATPLAKDVRAAPHCFVLRGQEFDPETLHYLRDVLAILKSLLDERAVAVLDTIALQWSRATEVRAAIEGPFDAKNHVRIQAEKRSTGTELRTHGLRKFGRSDLRIRDLPEHAVEGARALLGSQIVHQANGGLLADGQTLHVAGLGSVVCKGSGAFDDPTFGNTHLELVLAR